MVNTAFTGDKRSINQTKEESSTVEATTESTMTQGTEASHLSFQLTSHKQNAKDVWDVVKDTYSNLENASQIFELKIKLWKARQGEKEVTFYYNEMMSL
ncbi:hypothetical protein J1N35_041265 [Gossypium stocksii]|uniref:Retrotransposon gag domain-containing protein n=1 Tax=Gossypium stocksii TaxID=47602 RepID=A0A9D3ZJ40_9ROSI|nr:hypothetical protein J1N35_041265 [Gossypium stocksii]